MPMIVIAPNPEMLGMLAKKGKKKPEKKKHALVRYIRKQQPKADYNDSSMDEQ